MAPSSPSPSRLRASGDRRKAQLADIAILTGGEVRQRRGRPVPRDRRHRAAGSRPQGRRHQGRDHHRRGCRRRRRHRRSRQQIRAEIEASDSDYDREKLQERLAKLAGGVAVIKAGAATEVELKERKHRIEDAVRNAKAAVEEGIVAGGGVALLQSSPVLDDLKLGRRGHRCQQSSKVALEAPLKRRSRSTPASSPASSRRRFATCPPAAASTPPPVSTRTCWLRASTTRSSHPLGAAECCVHRGSVPDHRGCRRRQAGKAAAPMGDPTGGMGGMDF
ncbi:hypothetical protein GS500_24210 [Rhodococcus hoagii]|nr:hypothetical protein [Prescottella equi]